MKSVSVSSNVSSIQYLDDDAFDSALKNYKGKLILKNKVEIEVFAKRLLARGQEEDIHKLKTAWSHFSHKWALDAVIKGVVCSETSDEQLVLAILQDLKQVALQEEPNIQDFLTKREDPSRSLFSLDSGNSFGVPETCHKGWMQVLSLLLEEFLANVDEQDKEGCTGLHRAILNRRLDIVRKLVEEFKADLHLLNRNQETYLFVAVEAGGYDICKYLIERGIDRDKINSFGQTAAKLVKKSDASILALFIRPELHANQKKPPVLVADMRSRTSSACEFESSKSLSPVKVSSYFKETDGVVKGLSKKTGVSAFANRAPPKESVAGVQSSKHAGHRLKHSRGHKTMYYLVYTDEKKMLPTIITKPYFRAFELRFPVVASLLSDSTQSITEARATQLLAELKAPRIEVIQPPKLKAKDAVSSAGLAPADEAASKEKDKLQSEEPCSTAENEDQSPPITIVHDFSFAKNVLVMGALKKHRYAYVLAKPWYVLGMPDCINDLSLLGISDKLNFNCYGCNHEWIDDVDKMFAEALSYCGVFCDVGKAVLKLRGEWIKQLKTLGVQRCSSAREKIISESPLPAASTSRKVMKTVLRASPRHLSPDNRPQPLPLPAAPAHNSPALHSDARLREVPSSSLTKKTAQKTIIKPNNRQAFKEDQSKASPIRQIPITSYFRTSILNMIIQDRQSGGAPQQSSVESRKQDIEIEVSDNSEDFAQAELLEKEARPLGDQPLKLPK